jgi:hypothetical protein
VLEGEIRDLERIIAADEAIQFGFSFAKPSVVFLPRSIGRLLRPAMPGASSSRQVLSLCVR